MGAFPSISLCLSGGDASCDCVLTYVFYDVSGAPRFSAHRVFSYPSCSRNRSPRPSDNRVVKISPNHYTNDTKGVSYKSELLVDTLTGIPNARRLSRNPSFSTPIDAEDVPVRGRFLWGAHSFSPPHSMSANPRKGGLRFLMMNISTLHIRSFTHIRETPPDNILWKYA
jgi:hypothetical protein